MLVFLFIAVVIAIFITNLRINWLDEDRSRLAKLFWDQSASQLKDFQLYIETVGAHSKGISELELSQEKPAPKPAPKARKKNVQAK